MCMKINELSSNRRSKTEMGACAQDRSGFVPSAASTIRRRARRAQLGVAPLPVGGLATTHASRQRRKSRAGRTRAPIKMLKMKDRSGNVYENKGPGDNLPDTKDDISARLHAILHRNTRILQKPSALLPLFERWGTNPSLQNVETRAPAFPPGGFETCPTISFCG